MQDTSDWPMTANDILDSWDGLRQDFAKCGIPLFSRLGGSFAMDERIITEIFRRRSGDPVLADL